MVDKDETSWPLIGSLVHLRGVITGEASLELRGSFEGRLCTQGGLRVASSARLQASAMEVARLIVAGEVVGDVLATESVTIERGGEVFGDVETPRLRLEDGGALRGRVTMRTAPEREASKPGGEAS